MIKSVTIQNLMGYGKFKSNEFASVNVIIGKNDTGKTGLLKLLYATAKTIDVYSKRKQNEDVSFKRLLAEKLFNTYQPGIGYSHTEREYNSRTKCCEQKIGRAF